MDFLFPTIVTSYQDPWEKCSSDSTLFSVLTSSIAPVLHPITGIYSNIALAMTPLIPAPPSLSDVMQAPVERVRLYTPREESFAELIFPGFEPDALIWSISLFQIGEFLLSLALSPAVNPGMPTPCTLYHLGASWGPSIAAGQLWRLVLPMTLHANMMHLFFNIFFQLRMGFNMEKCWGKKRFMGLYVFCGIVGNMISVAVDPYKLAVGASTAGFGLIGVWMAELVLSWDLLGPHRDRSLVWLAFMGSAVIMMSAGSANVDMFGHLGGAIGGFLLAVVVSDMPDQYKPVWYEAFKYWARVGLLGLVGGCALKIGVFTPRIPLPAC